MNSEKFNQWVGQYEADIYRKRSVFPFNGYFRHVDFISSEISKINNPLILDLGIGTGLMHSLINSNVEYDLWGVDFSQGMCDFASQRLECNQILEFDITQDKIPIEIANLKFDLILSCYCFHHFTNDIKVKIINRYSNLLNNKGRFILADIAFDSIRERSNQRLKAGKSWDMEEEKGYWIKNDFIKMVDHSYKCIYTKISDCSARCELIKYL